MRSFRYLRCSLGFSLLIALIALTHESIAGAPRLADIQVTSVSVTPTSAHPGDTVLANASLANRNPAHSDRIDITFSLVGATGASISLKTVSVGQLNPKKTLQVSTSLNLPAHLSDGHYSLRAHATLARDANPDNNVASVSLRLSAIANISPTAALSQATDIQTTTSTTDTTDTAAISNTTSSLTHSTSDAALTNDASSTSDTSSTTDTPSASPKTDISPYAASYYVATTGSDSNPGTETRPFRTVGKGVSVLTSGTILYVMGGTYREALIHNIPPGRSWERPVTVAAYPGHTVTLKPDAGPPAVLRFVGPQAFIVIDGLVIDATNVGYDAIKITGSGSPITPESSAHHIRIVNCVVKNAPKQGILVTGYSDSNEFINLHVHDNGKTDFDHGIYIATNYNLIEGSAIFRNAGSGVHIYDGSGEANYNIVRNNMMYSNARVGPRGTGVILTRGVGNQAYNNIVFANVRGFFIDYKAIDTQVYNNTVYNNAGDGITIGSGSSRADVRNNIVYRNARTIVDNGQSTSKSHNLTQDPRFLSEATRDFRLRTDSPAIDAGVLLSIVPFDFLAVPRPQGNSHDVGAFEVSR